MSTDTMTADPAPQTPAQTTIGDLIAAKKTAKAALSQATQTVAEANATLKTASDADTGADTALATGLAETGPVYEVGGDNTAQIFSPDGANGYHVTTAKPVSTAVSITPGG